MADALATLASMFRVSSSDEVQLIKMMLNENSAYYAQIEDGVDKKPWYYDIRQDIKDQQYCPFSTRLDFNHTNNMAEYKVWAMGLHVAIDKAVEELEM